MNTKRYLDLFGSHTLLQKLSQFYWSVKKIVDYLIIASNFQLQAYNKGQSGYDTIR